MLVWKPNDEEFGWTDYANEVKSFDSFHHLQLGKQTIYVYEELRFIKTERIRKSFSEIVPINDKISKWRK